MVTLYFAYESISRGACIAQESFRSFDVDILKTSGIFAESTFDFLRVLTIWNISYASIAIGSPHLYLRYQALSDYATAYG